MESSLKTFLQQVQRKYRLFAEHRNRKKERQDCLNKIKHQNKLSSSNNCEAQFRFANIKNLGWRKTKL